LEHLAVLWESSELWAMLSLCAVADDALYRAKRDGRNRTVLARVDWSRSGPPNGWSTWGTDRARRGAAFAARRGGMLLALSCAMRSCTWMLAVLYVVLSLACGPCAARRDEPDPAAKVQVEGDTQVNDGFALRFMQRHKAAMCACTESACAEGVHKRMTEEARKLAQEGAPAPGEAEQREVESEMRKMAKCMASLTSASP
jgi:hypothetical protein